MGLQQPSSQRQIGIGGFSTVRGYEERQLNTDDGFILNTEIRTPFLPCFPKSWGRKEYSEGLQFLVFLDYGYGRNHTPSPKRANLNFFSGQDRALGTISTLGFMLASIGASNGIRAIYSHSEEAWSILGLTSVFRAELQNSNSDPNPRFLCWIRIFRKSPMTNRICRFAKNRTGFEIIEFGQRSEFCRTRSLTRLCTILWRHLRESRWQICYFFAHE